MSIQRIDHKPSHTHGWQARNTLPGTKKRQRRLTRFFSDGAHGGIDGAYGFALLALRCLKRRAGRFEREGA